MSPSLPLPLPHQMMVVSFDELKQREESTLRSIFAFLGVEMDATGRSSIATWNYQRREKAGMAVEYHGRSVHPRTREALRAHFDPWRHRLSRLVGRDVLGPASEETTEDQIILSDHARGESETTTHGRSSPVLAPVLLHEEPLPTLATTVVPGTRSRRADDATAVRGAAGDVSGAAPSSSASSTPSLTTTFTSTASTSTATTTSTTRSPESRVHDVIPTGYYDDCGGGGGGGGGIDRGSDGGARRLSGFRSLSSQSVSTVTTHAEPGELRGAALV
jgi:hypothetical protein